MNYAININGQQLCDGILQEISQSLTILLMTRKGEKIGEPDYGCGAFEHLDKPSPFQDMIMDIYDAIERYEPRVTVKTIVPQQNTEHVTITITYTINSADDDTIYQLVI